MIHSYIFCMVDLDRFDRDVDAVLNARNNNSPSNKVKSKSGNSNITSMLNTSPKKVVCKNYQRRK